MRRVISLAGIIILSLTVFGCQNIFKSMEVLDTKDKQQIADLAKENGDKAAVESNAKAILSDIGANYASANVGTTQAEKQARADLAMVELAKLDTAPIDLLKNVISASSSGNAQNADFFQTIVSEVPATSNKAAVLLAADNLRMNVNTANANEALAAAAAETTAVTILLKDAGLVSTQNQSLTNQQITDKWDTVSTNLLIHAQGAVDMFNYTDNSGNNQALTDASDKLKRLEILNATRASIGEVAFATSLNAILQGN